MIRGVASYGRSAGAPDPERDLLVRHATLLDRAARRLAARTGGAVEPGDLWAAGATGLLEAARRFDPARDVKFETFAEHRVRGAMLDELRRMDHLPRRLRSEAERVETARVRLAQEIGREPSPDEVSEALGVPVEQVCDLLQLLQPVVPLEHALASPAEAPEDLIGRSRSRRALADAIAELPERLRILLALYYEEELTYREIAKVLGVSEPRVCQLHADAVRRLRAVLADAAP